MTDDKVNKIIAEFMGYYQCEDSLNWEHENKATIIYEYDPMFTESLDALVPVWEKLKNEGVWFNKLGNRNYVEFSLFSVKTKDYTPFNPFNFYESVNDTIQQAAAHATAKAILELGEQ